MELKTFVLVIAIGGYIAPHDYMDYDRVTCPLPMHARTTALRGLQGCFHPDSQLQLVYTTHNGAHPTHKCALALHLHLRLAIPHCINPLKFVRYPLAQWDIGHSCTSRNTMTGVTDSIVQPCHPIPYGIRYIEGLLVERQQGNSFVIPRRPFNYGKARVYWPYTLIV